MNQPCTLLENALKIYGGQFIKVLKTFQIRRLLTQISFDKTALTGCKMFVVKRGIILNVSYFTIDLIFIFIYFS